MLRCLEWDWTVIPSSPCRMNPSLLPNFLAHHSANRLLRTFNLCLMFHFVRHLWIHFMHKWLIILQTFHVSSLMTSPSFFPYNIILCLGKTPTACIHLKSKATKSEQYSIGIYSSWQYLCRQSKWILFLYSIGIYSYNRWGWKHSSISMLKCQY